MDNLTWKCDVCNRERPDGLVSVTSQDISLRNRLPPGSMYRNVKYCNDNPQCVFVATRSDFVPKYILPTKGSLCKYESGVPGTTLCTKPLGHDGDHNNPSYVAGSHSKTILLLPIGILIILLILAALSPLPSIDGFKAILLLAGLTILGVIAYYAIKWTNSK